MKHLNFTLAGMPMQIRGGYVSLSILGLSLILMVASIWAYGWMAFVGMFLFVAIMIGNSIVVIQPGFAAYTVTLGQLSHNSLLPGPHLVWPFVTEVTNVDTKINPHGHTFENIDTKEVYKMGVKVTIHYGLAPKYVWMLANHLMLPIDEKYLCVWLREILKDEIARLSCAEIKENEPIRLALQSNVKTRFLKEVDAQFLVICGGSIFSSINLVIEDYIYDTKYVEIINNLEAQKVETQIAEEKKKQTEKLAEAKKIAILAAGEAENDVLERLGQILKEHPELNINELAKHFPQVFGGGGVMPTINMEQMLKGGKPQFDPNAK